MKKLGRRPMYREPMRDYRIRLTKTHAESLREEGKGNLSEGARTLIEQGACWNQHEGGKP
jgi:hypothetical protein